MKNIKRKHIVIGAIILVLAAGAGYLLGFTSIGYFATIQFRGFNEIQDKVYVDADYLNNDAEILSILNDAEVRLSGFWGNIQSNPTIIISENKCKLAKMGLKTSPALTARIFANSCFVVISPDGMNLDVISHELTHAELYAKLYPGKFPLTTLVPTWFDEGVAIQNDYREKYNEEAWRKATDNGENVVSLSEIDTPAKFYAGDEEERRYRYIVSKHELSEWIEQNGKNALFDLIDKVNQGESFDDLYFIK